MLAQLGPIVLEMRDGWADVTHDVPSEHNPPWTLVRHSADARGALQLSFALYRGGTVPDPTPETLAALVRDFGVTAGLGPATDELTESGPLRLAAATFRDQECVIRAWYVSDGRNFAKITYTVSIDAVFQSELADCEQMIRSIRFVAHAARVS